MKAPLLAVVDRLLVTGAIVMAAVLPALLLAQVPADPAAAEENAQAVPSVAAEPTAIKETITFESVMGRVEFAHRQHVEEFGVECASCHHEVRARELKTPHDRYLRNLPVDCARCHHAGDAAHKIQACSNCHDAAASIPGPDDLRMGARAAVHLTCAACHEFGQGCEASQKCITCHAGPKKPR
ncbi:MAG: cytochrome c3 family protein [Pseudomonadota bacterium]